MQKHQLKFLSPKAPFPKETCLSYKGNLPNQKAAEAVLCLLGFHQHQLLRLRGFTILHEPRKCQHDNAAPPWKRTIMRMNEGRESYADHNLVSVAPWHHGFLTAVSHPHTGWKTSTSCFIADQTKHSRLLATSHTLSQLKCLASLAAKQRNRPGVEDTPKTSTCELLPQFVPKHLWARATPTQGHVKWLSVFTQWASRLNHFTGDPFHHM